MISRLRFLAATAMLAAVTTVFAAEPKVLNVYNWSDYIADDTIRNFEKETGIKVNYDNYDSNEVLLAKLVAGNTGYDVVVPGAHFAKTQIEGGLLQKLDRTKLTNWKNLDPTLLKQLAIVDPGNQYLVDWLWGYVTVGIHVPKVKAALAAGPNPLPMPDNAWSSDLRPEVRGQAEGLRRERPRLGLRGAAGRDAVRGQAALQHERRPTTTPLRRCCTSVRPFGHAVLVVGLHQRPRRRVSSAR